MKDKKTKRAFLGYGIAGFGDSTFYSILGSFLLFFLTSVAHIPAGLAGFISSMGSVVDGIWSPIMGFISDNHQSPKGRRRPFMVGGAAMAGLSLALIFITIPGSIPVKCVYYGALVIIFWVSFSTFFVPYLAMGAEIATDYDDRTLLRTMTSMCGSAGTLASTVAPTAIVALLIGYGLSKQSAWACVGIIVGLAGFLSVFIGWKMTAGAEPAVKIVKESFSVPNILKEYLAVFKLKTIRYLLLGSVVSLLGYTMMTTGRMYLLTYNMGYAEAKATLVFFISTIIWFCFAPVLKIVSDRLEKRGTYILGAILTVGCGVLYWFKGFSGFGDLMIYVFFISLGSCCYWQLFPAMMYDISEVDTYINGKRREGTIMSLQALAEALASAAAIFLSGIVLNIGGFDGTAAVQSHSAEMSILALNTLCPALFFGLGIICVWLFPMTKKRHRMLQKAIKENVSAADNNPEYDDLKVLT